MHCFYVLYSKKIDKYYTGISGNAEIRLGYHNAGHGGSVNSFTKRTTDWKLLWKKEFETKTEALKFERMVKSKRSRKFIENLIKGYLI